MEVTWLVAWPKGSSRSRLRNRHSRIIEAQIMDERCSGGIVARALEGLGGWGVFVRDFVEECEGEDGEEGDDDCEPE